MSKKSFVLHGVNVKEVNQKYGLTFESRPEETTAIDDLYTNRNDYIYPYIDSSKRFFITMVDSMTRKQVNTAFCFWCRHGFGSLAIGCPIRFHPRRVRKSMVSELTGETYELIQPITIDSKTNDETIDAYYETDGGFCSFNCCLAFIRDNAHNPLYSRSEELLMRMYIEIFNVDYSVVKRINPAPSWRLLKEYGGLMTIDEFRASFQTHIYVDREYTFSRTLRLCPVGRVYEEQVII